MFSDKNKAVMVICMICCLRYRQWRIYAKWHPWQSL